MHHLSAHQTKKSILKNDPFLRLNMEAADELPIFPALQANSSKEKKMEISLLVHAAPHKGYIPLKTTC
jgi:hypothetical protein